MHNAAVGTAAEEILVILVVAVGGFPSQRGNWVDSFAVFLSLHI